MSKEFGISPLRQAFRVWWQMEFLREFDREYLLQKFPASPEAQIRRTVEALEPEERGPRR